MAGEIVAYRKQGGEPPVPLTVRIDWLPNGSIVPKMYWTPDGACYKIRSHSDSVPLAFLKDRGEGLRFKVRAEIIETPETNDELLHAKYESFLYLADNRFCQKNIIDERYGHTGKEYIPVTLDVFPGGDYELAYFWVHGARYKVEDTTDVGPRGAFQAGGVGLWHKVEARLVGADDDEDPNPDKSIRRPAALYLEFNKWFITVKNTG